MPLILTSKSIPVSPIPPLGSPPSGSPPPGPAPINNPDWSNVLYLFHFDGTNGSTNFIEEKGTTTVGHFFDIFLTTSQSKFGSASLTSLDGGMDITNIPFGGLEANGDFTLECWIYTTSLSSTRCIVDTRGDAVLRRGLWRRNDRLVWFFDPITEDDPGFCPTDPIPLNTWIHVAVVVSGSTLKIYVNGVSNGNTYTGVIGASHRKNIIANDGTGGNIWQGFIDELRVTRGLAIYTSNFTPPTAAFPNG